MKRFTEVLTSTWMMGLLLVVYMVTLAVATFVENDFGAATSGLLIYKARWLEILYILLAVNIIGNLVRFRLYQWKKMSIFIFHAAFFLLIGGGAITRYAGYEGMMHIREGSGADNISSSERYLSIEVQTPDGMRSQLSRQLEYSPLKKGGVRETFSTGTSVITIRGSRWLPNAVERAVETADGAPVVSFYFSAGQEMTLYHLQDGGTRDIGGTLVSLNSPGEPGSLAFTSVADSFYFTSREPFVESGMMGGEQRKFEAGRRYPLEKKKFYIGKTFSFVIHSMLPEGRLTWLPAPPDPEHRGKLVLVLDIETGGRHYEMMVPESAGIPVEMIRAKIGGLTLSAGFGPREIRLPFEVRLKDFTVERYPGSSSPSSFESEIEVVDHENGTSFHYRIFMNNVLDYRGYRLFQASYDKDEAGTILSVSHDRWGTLVSYAGYVLLILGILWSLVNPHSYFRSIGRSAAVKKPLIFLLLFSSTLLLQAQHPVIPPMTPPGPGKPDRKHAQDFGKLLVQDNQGRTEPLNTLSAEITRKVTRKGEFNGLTPDQLFLSMQENPAYWEGIPMIRVVHPELKKMLGISGDYAAFLNFLDDAGEGRYKLARMVDAAFGKKPVHRTKLDKDIIRVDERVNIFYMVITGQFLKVFPVYGDTTHNWKTPGEAWKYARGTEDSTFLRNIFNLYIQSLRDGMQGGSYAQAREYLEAISLYQRKTAGYELPGEGRVNLELFYNQVNLFKKLFPFYLFIGLVLIVLHVSNIIVPRDLFRSVFRFFSWLLFAGMLLHAAGLALRWVISGHAPMSNGYESMVFISWITILAGFFFMRRNSIALAATSVLAGLALMVANMSFMDPEITNLVPVLKSIWLTLHVSVITSSYGFLGLGAILGLVSLMLYSLMTMTNHTRIEQSIREITIINQKTLIIGLYLITIGTFLGAVWANESWGRYWGWDPKETWSLITILVYAFVSHMRLIPGLKSQYSFSLASLFAFGSVLMTYFGVNYYLSGLHSYAGGDQVPVPGFVYITLMMLFLVAAFSYFNHKKYERKETVPVTGKD